MALSSMTGFARVDGRAAASAPDQTSPVAFVIEARSVNGRQLEVRFKGPPGWEETERKVKELAQTRFARGQIAVSLKLTAETPAARREVDEVRLDGLVRLAARYADRPGVAPARLDGLMALALAYEPGRSEEAQDPALEAGVMEALALTLDRLKDARHAEGAALEAVLTELLQSVEATTHAAAAAADAQPGLLKAKFHARLQDLLAEAGDLEPRVMAEAAALALRADVREELDRLRVHVASARALMAGAGPQGRKLDFLTQEFMREANTLCSKAAVPDLTAAGLQLKALIDQFREQVQNVE